MNKNDDRRFASCKIKWKIENFCFLHRTEEHIIYSPVFLLQGLSSMKWRMSLHVAEPSKFSMLSVFLEKIAVSETEDLFVKWEFTLTAGKEVYGPYEKNSDFGKITKHGIDTNEPNLGVLKHLVPCNPDTVIIILDAIIFKKENPVNVENKPTCGLLLLSEDLKVLKDADNNHADIKFDVKRGKYIEAHKAILYRNGTLDDSIKKASNGIIHSECFDYNTVDEFITFLYTGNAEHILSQPSVSTIKCFEYFNCETLKCYYFPEEVNMLSRIKVEEHEFHWVIPDTLYKGFIDASSPPIKRLNVNTTWKLNISMKMDDPHKYISIFAKIIEGERPRYLCLEFAILNESGVKFYPRRIVRTNRQYDNLGFEQFVKKSSLMNNSSLSLDGSLRILFRVKTSEGIQENSMGCRSISFVSSTGATTYEKLSARMGELLEKNQYSDIEVECDNKIMKAHKCILSARSPGFKQKIESLSCNKLTVTEVESDVLEFIMKYIYTGVLKDIPNANLLALYTASSKDKLDVPSLNEECLKRIIEKGIEIQKQEST